MGSSNGVPAGKRLFPACILTQPHAQCMRVVRLDSCSTRLRHCGRCAPKKCVSYRICFIPSPGALPWCLQHGSAAASIVSLMWSRCVMCFLSALCWKGNAGHLCTQVMHLNDRNF